MIIRCKCCAGTPITSTRLCTSPRRGTWCSVGATTTRPSFGKIASVLPLSISPLLSCLLPGTSRTLARWNPDGGNKLLGLRLVYLRCWLARNREWFPCSIPPRWHQSCLWTVAPPLSSPPPGPTPTPSSWRPPPPWTSSSLTSLVPPSQLCGEQFTVKEQGWLNKKFNFFITEKPKVGIVLGLWHQ